MSSAVDELALGSGADRVQSNELWSRLSRPRYLHYGVAVAIYALSYFFFFSIAIYTLTPDLVIKSAVFWSISTGPYSLSSRLQAVDQVSFLTD